VGLLDAAEVVARGDAGFGVGFGGDEGGEHLGGAVHVAGGLGLAHEEAEGLAVAGVGAFELLEGEEGVAKKADGGVLPGGGGGGSGGGRRFGGRGFGPQGGLGERREREQREAEQRGRQHGKR
jgi:hypothetical protein